MKRFRHGLSILIITQFACATLQFAAEPTATLPPPWQPTEVISAAPTDAPAASTPAAPPSTAAPATQDYVTFSINAQDFAYPELSIALLHKIITLHEQYQIPVDIYLTTTMTDLYAAQAPDLIERLKTSPVVSVSYHVRPPKPYHTKYDWLGLAQMSPAQQYDTIMNYETHGLDLATGQPTAASGGYQLLSDILGYNPYIASVLADAELGTAARTVFKDLGASFTIVHGRAINLGDTLDGLYIKPEHYDYKLFEFVGQDAATAFENALAEAHKADGAHAPYFVGVKMHDNDFFAEKSAWLTVYVDGGKRPPWNANLKSPLLSAEAQDQMWKLYESTVAYAASIHDRVTPVNAPMILAMETGTQTVTQPPTQAATQTTTGASLLYVSGTMHIETKWERWPNPDALLAFMTRATATGMRWSIGADIGWLQGESRAAEIIRATEAMGVQWDVHAHEHADRPRNAALITQYGGHATTVTSGLRFDEIDLLRSPLTSPDGFTWQAESVWGIVTAVGHRIGSDDLSVGVWRPESGANYLMHDPNGNLIAVGGGTRNLAGAEEWANKIASGSGYPPVLSATIMVAPDTLTVVDENVGGGGSDGIGAIEAFAARMSALPVVRWATIAETAAAWVAAGEVPSRMDSSNP